MIDHSEFTFAQTARAWDAAADAWNEFVESAADYYRTEVHGAALVKACGDVSGLRVLDLGCGQGWLCRQLASRGATVTSVDISGRQIEFARKHEADLQMGVEYTVLPVEHVEKKWAPGEFDLVTACMSFHDMHEPDAALRGAAILLLPDASLVFSKPHPATDTPYREWERGPHDEKHTLKIDRYFESGHTTLKWDMKRLAYAWETPMWRRTLSEWSALISEAGFLIRRIHEPRPTA